MPVGTPGHVEKIFGRNVREFRRRRGWSQEDLAQRLSAVGYSMHQTTVAKLEAGSRPTPVGEAKALAGIFEVSIEDLFAPPWLYDAELGTAAEQAAQTEQELVKLAERRERVANTLRNYERKVESAEAELVQVHQEIDYLTSRLGYLRSLEQRPNARRMNLPDEEVDWSEVMKPMGGDDGEH